jgi:1,5-anhydro-D-fructose reductase (1,5-anhydro-D-mannitol-forming)
MIGWGIIGTGGAVQTLMLPALRASATSKVVGFVSHDPSRARALAAQHGADAWPDVTLMLEDPRVDVVYVASRHDEHAVQVEMACAAKKHVLCEKPLALSMRDAESSVEAARQNGVVLAICHPLRGLPAMDSLRDTIRRGEIGRVIAARATYSLPIRFPADDWHRRGPAAGVMFDITVHSVDILRYVLAREVVRCRAVATSAAEWSAPPSVVLSLAFEDEVLGSTFDSYEASAASNGLEVNGAGGTLIADGAIGSVEPSPRWTLRRPGEPDQEVSAERPDQLFGATVERFLAAIEGRGGPLAPGEDHLRTLRVVMDASAQVAAASRFDPPS